MCFNQQKTALSSGFFVYHCLLCLRLSTAINRVNLGFRTTIIEDTHLTLAVIPFKVETNNCLIFLSLQTYEKKFAKFPFLLVYNSLDICFCNKRYSSNMCNFNIRIDTTRTKSLFIWFDLRSVVKNFFNTAATIISALLKVQVLRCKGKQFLLTENIAMTT